VFAEGAQILNDFDIAANGGGKAALVKSFPVTVSDGRLDLSFKSVRENSILSAIELVPAGDVPENPPPAPSDLDGRPRHRARRGGLDRPVQQRARFQGGA
jgi:hypothetical protein